MAGGCLLHCDGQRGLVRSQLLGIADALQVVGEGVQDRIPQQLGSHGIRRQLESWLLLLQDSIEGLVHLQTVYFIRDHLALSLKLIIITFRSPTHRCKRGTEANRWRDGHRTEGA